MTVLTFRFYRLDTTISPTGEAATERVEVRPPIDYDSFNPAPGTEIKIWGFPPCECPQAPACHAKEKESRRASPRSISAPAAAVPEEAPVLAGA
jgi:hypothetical protein